MSDQDVQLGLQIAWKANNSYIIFIMQLGFCLLEAGSIKYNNDYLQILLKNMINTCISGIVFWMVGYGLVFGKSQSGIIGSDKFFLTTEDEPY